MPLCPKCKSEMEICDGDPTCVPDVTYACINGCGITTSACESIVELHNRMPVILNPEVYEQWLDVKIQDPKELESILEDGIVHDMKYYPVSSFVNSVKKNDPSCIKPIDENL